MQPTQPGQYPDGLCDCANDISICCYGMFCTMCLSAQNLRKIDHGGNLLKVIFIKAPEFWMRQVIRRRANMEEECIYDVCASFTIAYPCAVCQDARALKQGIGTPRPGDGYFGHITSNDAPNQKFAEPLNSLDVPYTEIPPQSPNQLNQNY